MSDIKRAMIDFETIGNGKNACLIQVGACYFGGGQIFETLKLQIDAEDSQRNGAVPDASTVYWWLDQSPEARASITAKPRIPERKALEQLNDFLSSADEIWSHATFDFVILMEALKRLEIKPKFSYRSARDIRTLHALSGLGKIQRERDGTHHDALDDAIFQAGYVTDMLSALGR